MIRYLSVALLFGFASLCVSVHAADKTRVKPRRLTTNQKLEQLIERQQAMLKMQEAQQKQLNDMSQRLNAVNAVRPASPAYSYP